MIHLPFRLTCALATLSACITVAAPLRAVDGALDASYDAKLDSSVGSIAVQTDGRALISGQFRSAGGQSRTGVSRLNADGTLDVLYNPNSLAKGGPIALQPDGTVFATDGGSHVVRINSDGRANPVFNANAASVGGGTIHALAVQNDGKILVGGDFNAAGTLFTDGVLRLNADGTLDTGFVSHAGFYSVKSLALLADDSFYAAGGNGSGSTARPIELAHLSAGGGLLASVDATFDPTRDTSAEISQLALQPDGRLLVAGRFNALQGVARPGVARLNADGSVDTSFDPGSGPANFNTILALLLQADGKVVVGGGFTTFNGATRNRVARLNADGRVDSTFDVGTGAGSASGEFNGVEALALAPDGSLFVGGDFTLFSGVARVGLARLGGSGVVVTPPTGKESDVSGTVDNFIAKLNKKGTKTIIKGTLTLTNSSAKAAQDVTISVFLSADAALDATADTLLGTFSLADYGYVKLPKHATVGPLAFRIPSAASLQTALRGKYVIVNLDVAGKHPDGDLTNNRIIIGPLP